MGLPAGTILMKCKRCLTEKNEFCSQCFLYEKKSSEPGFDHTKDLTIENDNWEFDLKEVKEYFSDGKKREIKKYWGHNEFKFKFKERLGIQRGYFPWERKSKQTKITPS